jgi:uncharacterized membrane protein YfcA
MSLDPFVLIYIALVSVFAGLVKGTVGFAQPMVMMSGIGSLLAADVALGLLIIPTLITNVWQALRGGVRPMLAAVVHFRRFLLILLVVLALSAQLVPLLPSRVMFLLVGVPIVLFAVPQLFGWQPRLAPRNQGRGEVVLASLAGFIGGTSGTWGAPTVAYLTMRQTPKVEQVRIQGVIYGAGAVMLVFAHLQSGVLNAQVAPLSLALAVPALAGLAIGFQVQDRLDQERFKRITLIVLAVAGLNLIRRGLM